MTRKRQAGFTLLETMVALVILLGVSAVVLSGMVQMMMTQGTIANRTEMHTSVRAATELLQQEIGQAGKISLPPTAPAGGWRMLTPVNVPASTPLPFVVTFTNDSTGAPVLFEGEWVTVDTGASTCSTPAQIACQETVQLTCAAGKGNCPGLASTWLATFTYSHNPLLAPVPFSVPGSFGTGIIPPAAGVMPAPPPGYAGYPVWPVNAPGQGSSGTVLKLYGDVNGDGNMVYIEYTCAPGTPNAPGFLYRNQVPWTAVVIPPVDPSMVVLTNVLPNPPSPNGAAVPCFTYQLQTRDGANAALNDMTFVTDVAVTLTVQTANKDPQMHIFQQETKALLNVSPRNVFNAYEFATLDYLNRIQPTPLNIKQTILPNFQ
jgi:prepilin-type N-terminal cleavage/methylation domain-containing protein